MRRWGREVFEGKSVLVTGGTGSFGKSFIRTLLTGYKIPKHVEFRDDLPRTNVGKILRRALKEGAPALPCARFEPPVRSRCSVVVFFGMGMSAGFTHGRAWVSRAIL